jgi:hypothetical protein
MATLIRCLVIAVSFVGLSFGGTVFAKGDACASVKAKAECGKKADCSWNGKHCAAKAAKAGKKAAATHAAKPAAAAKAAKSDAKAAAKPAEAPVEAPAEDPGMGEEPAEEDTEG